MAFDCALSHEVGGNRMRGCRFDDLSTCIATTRHSLNSLNSLNSGASRFDPAPFDRIDSAATRTSLQNR